MPYFDLPLQHSHPEILKNMNRPWQSKLNESILRKIRKEIPNAVLRTSLIVGFPGETSKHIKHLLDFLKTHQFDHVGVFTFSPEEGTLAFELPNRVSKEIAQSRKDNIMSAQEEISKNKKQSLIGLQIKVLVEDVSEKNQLIGRSFHFSPEIDGKVFLSSINNQFDRSYIGKFVEGNIFFTDEFDFYAEFNGIISEN